MKRKLVSFLSVILILAAASTPARAQQEVQVFVNGVRLDVPTVNVGGRTLVPLRAIFEALGAEVEWDGATRTASATWDGGSLSLPVGASQATVNGQTVQLDVPAQLIDGRTMVPLRFVGESMGALVGWYGNSRVITINKPAQAPVSATVVRVVDGDTVELTFADGRTEKLRMIGVDTPETVHPTIGEEPGGREASDFTKARLTGQTVLVEFDVEQRDQYGRLLGYVYTAEGAMFNATLVDQGYARLATYPPNVRYVNVFVAVQQGARGSSNDQPDSWNSQSGSPGSSQPQKPTSPASPGLRYDPFGPDRDCTDFATWEEAQAFYLAAGGPDRDPHRLDSDRDGIACESLR